MTAGVTPARAPLATVVIPTYNDAHLLLGAIERFQAQTWPNVEIVVADDGSDQPVEPKVRNWPGYDERVTVVRRATNGGVPAALQVGLERARGEFVHLSSTNDLVEPDFLQTNITALERDPRAGLCFCDAGIVMDPGNEREPFPLHLAPRETWFAPEDFAARMRSRPFHISSNAVVFRTGAIKATGGCRPDLELYGDWFACMVTALRDGAVYVPRVMAYSRVHAGAYSGRPRPLATRVKLAAAALRAIAAEAPEILPRLRRSAALSDLGLPVLLGLLRDPHARAIVSADTLWVALLRTGWRGVLPRSGRRLLRRMTMRPEAA
ncbi:MAG: glycosyltransferase family 2 protein [Bradyrhizobiaceae bacterium]|nr:glycosyltransferase family 2 protein [Bradyrhizobiaceae bacterium]